MARRITNGGMGGQEYADLNEQAGTPITHHHIGPTDYAFPVSNTTYGQQTPAPASYNSGYVAPKGEDYGFPVSIEKYGN